MLLSSHKTILTLRMMMPETVEVEVEVEDRSKSGDEESLDSFLTERQIEVLQMRLCGRSQQEVAEILGTTRSNISILEKRAHQNIARAERTLQQWMMLRAPISLLAGAGTDVFELPKMIFAAADEKQMRLPITSLDIVVQLRRIAPRLFKKRALERDARIFVTEEGEVLVEGL
jgi:Tfx family DNA-binding protein